jgi:DNA-binding Lrp family transcriptional regulator
MARLDDTDRQLLMLLQEDDRQPLAALSEKIGVAVSTINDRIKRLIRSGTISGFHARIAPEAVELEQPEDRGGFPGTGEGVTGRAGVPSHHRRLELSPEGSRRHHA